tara:strand:- start:265 stop:408 length:144 start_codon:yes stop_codon:yes gene_type:complete
VIIPFGVAFIMGGCMLGYLVFGKSFNREVKLINKIFEEIDKYINEPK